jgi:hypothetical protein
MRLNEILIRQFIFYKLFGGHFSIELRFEDVNDCKLLCKINLYCI